MTGKVRNLTSFGAFVEIEPGIDGLVHISDMSWTKRIQHPSEVVRKGDDVEVIILGVDAENKRISLGLKQTQEDPWSQIAQSYTPGRKLTGKITRLQDKGVAVDVGDDIEGFVPLSQLGVAGLQNPADLFAEGDELEMEVTEVDPENRRIVLNTTRVPKLEEGAVIRPAARPAAAEASASAEGGAPGGEGGESSQTGGSGTYGGPSAEETEAASAGAAAGPTEGEVAEEAAAETTAAGKAEEEQG
jgi:small subunit ribosomal protein S1